MTQKENRKWPERSQASILRQDDIEENRRELQGEIKRFKEKVVTLEARRKSCGKKPHLVDMLQITVADLRTARDMLEVKEELLRETEEEILSYTPTPEAAAQREEKQKALAALAEERAGMDRQVSEALGQLRNLLKKRRAFTEQMADHANNLEMDIDLDQVRFENLISHLPETLLAQSESWVDWFLGRKTGRVRAVCRGRVERRESLAHNGIYNLGDVVELSQAQFDQLHRKDRPAGKQYALWECKPPSVFSLEEHKNALAEAEEQNIPLEEVVACQDIRKFRQDEELNRAQLSGR
jgi:hypothetical protein